MRCGWPRCAAAWISSAAALGRSSICAIACGRASSRSPRLSRGAPIRSTFSSRARGASWRIASAPSFRRRRLPDMTADRFDELLSLYVDGRATDAELSELEGGMRGDPVLRRAFVERVRLDVGLTALFETEAAAAAVAPATSRRTRAPRRPSAAPSRLPRAAFAAAAALFVAALLLLVLRDRRPAPAEAVMLPTPPKGSEVVDVRRAAEEEHAAARADQRKTEERVAALREREAAAVRNEAPQAPPDEALARLRAER